MIFHLFNITVVSEILAFLFSLFLLTSKTKSWRLFIIFLLITLIVETSGWYTHWVLNEKQNDWIFNLLTIITPPFILYIFSKSPVLTEEKKRLVLSGIIYLVFAIVNLGFFQGLWDYNKYTDIFGSIILVYISVTFLLKNLKEDKFNNLFLDEYFWLSNGLLFYSLGSIIIYLFFESLRTFHKATNIYVFGYINSGLNILFYTSLIIAFICRRRNMN